MPGIAAIFVADSRRRVAAMLLAFLAFVLVLALAFAVGSRHTAGLIETEAREELARFTVLKRSAISTFEVMHREVTAEPCSLAFLDQLRSIAYLPDGLSQFFYAPGGVARCSATVASYDPPIDFGRPDVEADENGGRSLWLDRDLAFAQLPGLQGHLLGSEPFAVVVPRHDLEPSVPDWLKVELVLAAPSGQWWHRSGEAGVYTSVLERTNGAQALASLRRAFNQLHCDDRHCVAATIDPAAFVSHVAPQMFLALLAALSVAAGVGAAALRMIRRYWAFESRFLRNLGPDSIVCVYQPVLQVRDGGVCGCEVLVRWRDLDGTIVSPDRFLGIVERRQLTFRLTELVVQKAYRELAQIVPPGRPLQISFNIFPRDLDHRRLVPLFEPFLRERERFSVVVEVIECEEMPLEVAQAEIEALLAAGIYTHIDDFGVGFSNIHNLAALSVHAVKLDRAFAMAQEGEMLDRMLLPAIAMIRTCGHLVCVEGVENRERLEQLVSGVGADYLQGYHVSRPLSAADFVGFLTAQHGEARALDRAA